MSGYVAAWDDTYPLAMSYNTVSGFWRTGSYSAVPPGSTTSRDRQKFPRKVEESSVAFNALLAYGLKFDSFSDPNMPINLLGGDRFHPTQPYLVNMAYNGLLHGYPASAVVRPDKLPIVAQNYRENTVGFSISIMVLCCTDSGPSCRFNPDGYPQPGQSKCSPFGSGYGDVWYLSTASQNFSVWAYGKGMVFLTADGRAEVKELLAPRWPSYSGTNMNDNPWSSFEPFPIDLQAEYHAQPYWSTSCVGPGHHKNDPGRVFYNGYFRPDTDYQLTLAQCDMGGG